ncbi:MAG TPA: AbrB/MazE/SpoVT family DNA-binding domain-containing protein [Vicinamibacterales bacterium]|nr:AbrB/MazE/SpoVT family DNA-binding domain-containing protein [Vicinamibacterales bacterium]
MRITSKGQVTIPQHIREKLGLLPHAEVEFDIVENTVRIRKARRGATTRGAAIVGHLRGRGGRRWSTDEILAMTRGER